MEMTILGKRKNITERINQLYKKFSKDSPDEGDGFLLFMYLIVRKYVNIPMRVQTFYDHERKCQVFVAEFKVSEGV